MFVDDHPVERERVRSALPEVEVMGEDPFALRRALLSDPRLQTARRHRRIRRPHPPRQIPARPGPPAHRRRRRGGVPGVAGGGLHLRPSHRSRALLARVAELFQRTTQFNTTGRAFSQAELTRHAASGRVFIAHARDRFGDYGLVAAAVVAGGEITAFAMSCRVIGLKVEHRFLAFVLEALAADHDAVEARILPTPRNGPVRHLYADNGFHPAGEGVWRVQLKALRAAG